MKNAAVSLKRKSFGPAFVRMPAGKQPTKPGARQSSPGQASSPKRPKRMTVRVSYKTGCRAIYSPIVINGRADL